MDFKFEDIKIDKNYYESQWKNMPEFEQGPKKAYTQILIKFSTKENFDDFNKKLNTDFKESSKSAWYPSIPIRSRDKNIGWIDNESK